MSAPDTSPPGIGRGRDAGRISVRFRPRPAAVVSDGSWTLVAEARTLPGWMYCSFVAVAVLLTAGQLLALGRRLDAQGFGDVAIGISFTQGLFTFGDVGLGRLSDDTSRPKAQRDRLRTMSFAAVSVVLLATVVVAALASWRGPVALAACCALGAATAWALYPMQLRAQAAEAYGDEVGAARRHFLWQNGPKAGLIAGVLVTGDPVGSMVGGLVAAVLLCPPKMPSISVLGEIVSRWRAWLPSLLSVAAPFVLLWSDTYFVAAGHGVAGAAGYVLIYRILAAVSYVYLPFGSVLLSRLNKRDVRAAWAVPAASLAITLPVLLFLAFALERFGPRLFPGIPLDLSVVVPLVITNVFANAGYLAGTALAAVGRFGFIVRCHLAGAAVAVSGHLVFTLGGSLAVAAHVALAGIATAAVLQVAGAWTALRTLQLPRDEGCAGTTPRPR